MRPALILAISTTCAAGTACAPRADQDTTPPVADSATVAVARNAANALGPELMNMLTGELDRGGPEAALAVCADSAQVLTARHSTEGVHIRRVGTRVRNPLNAPDSLEAGALTYLADRLAAGQLPTEYTEVARTGPDGGWELRYLRPVVLLERCTACHGAEGEIPPAVRGLIRVKYPDDQAVGYRTGDLRGAVAVRVALPAAR
jgi:hypothetical protein